MRGPAERLFVSATFVFAIAISSPAAAQPAEAPEEITVQGGRTLGEYRLALERARDDLFRRFNEANQGSGSDVRCKDEQPTGSRMRRNVCRTAAENQADAASAFNFLGALLRSAGNHITGVPDSPPGTVPAANIGTAGAQTDAVTGAADALSKFEQQWMQLLSQDEDFYRAAVEYVELEKQYESARGGASAAPSLAVPGVAVTAAQPSGPQCEATTLTEYFQRGNVARVSGRVSIAACPAGTTGSYDIVARVRGESGEITPLEFSETWQRDDAEDVTFESDYPIGDDMELVSVRVRGLKCTCTQP